MTVEALLDLFVDQATCGKGTWLIRPDFVEITCVSPIRRPPAKNLSAETVDLAGAPASMQFMKVFKCLEEQLQSKGRRIEIEIDVAALQKAVSPRFDLAKLKVTLPHADPDLTLDKFVGSIIKQIPGSNASMLVVKDAVFITTVTQADRLRPLLPRMIPDYRSSQR
jgi:hypothetical protein